MRLNSIELSWFRGSSESAALQCKRKSVVVYGANGAGKSSFVDAIEFALCDGKIGHLSHEYSGKHQERGVLNTHKPDGVQAEIKFVFEDDQDACIAIADSGTFRMVGGKAPVMKAWEYSRTVLRANEVANFIHGTKGDKYSALLPLLGLGGMERAAQNLRVLKKAIEDEAQIVEQEATIRQLKLRREAAFPGCDDDGVSKAIESLYSFYCTKKENEDTELARCQALKKELETRTNASTEIQRRYDALLSIAQADISGAVKKVRDASLDLASSAEPLIAERLKVLQDADVFSTKLDTEEKIECPACGQLISPPDLKSHIKNEQNRLEAVRGSFNARQAAIGVLSDTLKSLKVAMEKAELADWKEKLAEGELASKLLHLAETDAEMIRESCDESFLTAIEANVVPLVREAKSESASAPPSVRELVEAKRQAETGEEVLSAKSKQKSLTQAKCLRDFVANAEQVVRGEIKQQSKAIIEEISADVREMWAILHPGVDIEGVSLYMPEDADKAIDIRLKFYSKSQDSPRLTLSEGYRNSLALCIFLATAKRGNGTDRPLFLDDVVVSLDRAHRGMIVELLEKLFSDRQVIVLTHDRDWFAEMRTQLDAKTWDFKSLLPYETPLRGIRWAHTTSDFAEARDLLSSRPDAAGNDARKILDTELALICDRLEIEMLYRRGEKNDKRMAHEFLERLAKESKKRFQIKVAGAHVANQEAVAAIEEADKLVLSWGNKGSHSKDLVKPEATKLIEACEKVVACFSCVECHKAVTRYVGPESLQCQCGTLKWKR